MSRFILIPDSSPTLSGNNNQNRTQCNCEKSESLCVDNRLSRSFYRRHSLNDSCNGSVPSQFSLNPHRISSFKHRSSNLPSPRLFKQIQFKEVDESKIRNCDHNLELAPLITWTIYTVLRWLKSQELSFLDIKRILLLEFVSCVSMQYIVVSILHARI